MSVQVAKHSFSVAEYERMGQTGVLAADDRVELIEGEIIEMSPVGSRHAACVKLLSKILNRQVGDAAIVSTQDPVRIDDYSEPQPDVALLKFRGDFYRYAHPTAADVLLMIEVADTTVEYDRHVKVPLYARAGVPEALIFNLPDEQLEYYAQPEAGSYQITRTLKRGEHLQSSSVAPVVFDVEAILG